MSKYDINDLLKKYREGTILPEEQVFLETWYLNWQPETQTIAESEILKAKARIWSSLKKRPFKLVPGFWLSAIAGMFLLIVLICIYRLNTNTDRQNLNAAKTKTDFSPGSNTATLTLASGKEVSLGNTGSGDIAKQGSITIAETDHGKLVYAGHNIGTGAATMMNKVTTPRGGTYQLVMSDGTKVWLNAASSITFPAFFNGKYRKVSIVGEVYFEVAHNRQKPFIVRAGDQEISVLGTHFNISAYQDDEFTTTALISGSVSVKNLKTNTDKLIRPGEGATTSVKSGNIELHKIDVDEITSWKNGYFQFDNQNIYSIMKVLSRWYNVDVEFLDDKNTEHFGGTFSRGRQLSETLANMEKLGNVHFKMTPKKIIVTK